MPDVATLQGFLSPSGEFYECDTYGHCELAKQIIKSMNRYSVDAIKTMCHENVLLKHGWVCVRARDVYKSAFDENKNYLPISNEQQSWFEANYNNLTKYQNSDIYEIVKDFGDIRHYRKAIKSTYEPLVRLENKHG